MELTDTFILNNSDILFEDFDDEIVAINLKSGYYYSINGSGILIWELLTKSFSPRQIIKVHTNAFPGTDAEFEQSIKGFITGLESEGLLVQSGEEDKDAEISEDFVQKIRSENKAIPKLPVFEKYTDQQELLLLDPIHEVSDIGWPDRKEDSPENE